MSPIYESCLLCMSHVSYLWVMSPLYESCLLYMSHVSSVWVMSPLYESCLLYMSHVSSIWVMSPLYAFVVRKERARKLRMTAEAWSFVRAVSRSPTRSWLVLPLAPRHFTVDRSSRKHVPWFLGFHTLIVTVELTFESKITVKLAFKTLESWRVEKQRDSDHFWRLGKYRPHARQVRELDILKRLLYSDLAWEQH
jgi:hypothetical protein